MDRTARKNEHQSTEERIMSRRGDPRNTPPVTSLNTTSRPERSKHNRPHSKTIVVGPSLKTRLHCNHLVPKCKCSNTSNRKSKTNKAKRVQERGSQRTVLTSSRSLARGEINGRKTYQDKDPSISTCDATWRPSVSCSEDKTVDNSDNHNYKYRNEGERVLKKKLRFEDEVTERNGRETSIKDCTNKNKKQEDNQSSFSVQNPSTPYTTTKAKKDAKKGKEEIAEEYCRLCKTQNIKKKQDYVHNYHHDTPTFNLDRDELSKESCFLCQKYRHLKCVCEDYCHVCNAHIYCSQRGTSKEVHNFCHRDSPPLQAAGGEHKHTPRKIPYEPRTKLVKNLKEKLETTYMSEEPKVKRTNVEANAASREAEDDGNSQTRNSRESRHMHPGMKCLHHYQQNDRLFLEATLTDRSGRSACSECGLPQPKDPQENPYLYHITLGGLKANNDKKQRSRSVNRYPDKENSEKYYMKTKKVSNNSSMFPYTKLNYNINNIMGRKGIQSVDFRPSVPAYHSPPTYSKRPPNRSMALMDHII